MFKKSFFVNNRYLYDYIYENTKNKFVLFGYFFSSKESFCGELDDSIMKVYCTDITLCFFNPQIIVEMVSQNCILITIKYNLAHYMLILLSLFIGVFSIFVGVSFPLNIFSCILLIAVFILAYKINFNWQSKKIIDYLLNIDLN